ncbi:MAG: SH3 domain-containing protein, partial [Lachnospiraceae bacterium]|nr:SH3 domain-containing protein [Candidatus Minthocola equi]
NSSLTSIPGGTTITITGGANDSSGTLWYKTSYNGKTGYVSSKYVKFTPAQEPQEPQEPTEPTQPQQPSWPSWPGWQWPTDPQWPTEPTTPTEPDVPQEPTVDPNAPVELKDAKGRLTSNLNVRKGPGTSYAIVTTLDADTVVDLLTKQNVDGTTWYQIQKGDVKGYVSGKYVALLDTKDDPTASKTTDTNGTGTVTASSLTVRKGPGTSYASIGSVSQGQKLNIFGGQYDTDGVEWYKITYNSQTGYVSSKYVTLDSGSGTNTDQTFEEKMAAQGFPQSYISKLSVLHNLYPNWEFKANKVDMSFNLAVSEQYSFGDMLPSTWSGTKAISLVDKNSANSWKSTDEGAYDKASGTYITGWDGDSWVVASKGIIKYFMDPRNFLDSNSVFQFLDMSYYSDQTASVVAEAAPKLNASWLGENYTHTSDNTTINYPEVLAKVGAEYGINPIALIAIITQELGVQNTAISRPQITGTTSGYEGLYNYFNIGAYVSSSFSKAYLRALYIAQINDWNTREAALAGGASYFVTNFVNKNQDTFYYLRFNVVNNKVSNQFSTDVQEATSWGKLFAKAYTEELRKSSKLVFKIPVFDDMPSSPCDMP